MDIAELSGIAARMVAPGKGLLAADEAVATIQKRFDRAGIENTPENRRDYRELLFRTTATLKDHIGGIILFDETIRQNAKDGTPMARLVEAAGALAGVKADIGAQPLAGCLGETVTEGLDGLRERFAEYRKLGACFSKWRAVIAIAPGVPSYNGVNANAQALARYAALAQEAGLVPIVEPEVLKDGDDDIAACAEITEWVLKEVFAQLYHAGVALEGMILKPNMVIAGRKCARRNSPGEVAEATLRVLKRCVPAAVPGIAFLSGGQEDEEATENLNAINQVGGAPWPLTFSFGRALQHAPQMAWGGKAQNVAAAQKVFAHRAAMNSLASLGRWTKESENTPSGLRT
ncbi:MAG TPA: class I fructose-bisphosphate aldolase [Rhizomicrobium sp.]